MEIASLIAALQETIVYLQQSQSSSSAMPVADIVRRLAAEIAKARDHKLVDIVILDRLFAPTGAIQSISIENGWGTKFLRLSAIVDEFISGTD